MKTSIFTTLSIILITGCGIVTFNSETSKKGNPAEVGLKAGESPSPTISYLGEQVPAHNQETPKSCDDIRRAESDLQDTFYPPKEDKACKENSDCVVGSPGAHLGRGLIMNEDYAKKRADGEKAYRASDELRKLQDAYRDLKCFDNIGVLPFQPTQSAVCELNQCVGRVVRSCIHTRSSGPERCLEYLSLTDSDAVKMAASCEQVDNHSWRSEGCTRSESRGHCKFTSTSIEPEFSVFYAATFNESSAKAACLAGEGPRKDGIWEID